MEKVTIKDVAKLAGVATSTVSRVIADSSRISEETKQVVRDAMKQLGYHPNAIARSLVNKTTNTLAVVMPQSAEKALLNPFFSQALSGISSACHEEGYCILMSTGSTEEEQLQSIRSIVMSGRVDGVIILYSSVKNLVLEDLKESNFPLIVIGKPLELENILYVDNNNVEAAFIVTEKLIKKGHKNIGLISGFFDYVFSLDRLEGYRAALIENGIDFDRGLIAEAEFTKEDGYIKMKEMLNMENRPTALVVTDDVMAFGAIEAIKEAKLSIPEDIEIISFNNVPLAEFCSPSLTSVDINASKLGFEAARLIIENIKGTAKEQKVIVPTEIAYRDTFRE